MDRCALFVDAGYLLADGAMAVHGTRRREAVSWNYAKLLELLSDAAVGRTQLPLLRCYWYEATPEGRRSPEHDALADIPGLKLRLGRVRPGRREGVDLMAYRDLTTLAREHAVSDAVLVTGDEDMVHAVTDAQDFGVRVIGVHVAVDGNWTISRTLRQECDDLLEVNAAQLSPYVNLLHGTDVASPPLSNGQASSGPIATTHLQTPAGAGRGRNAPSGHSGPQPMPSSSAEAPRNNGMPDLTPGHPSGPNYLPQPNTATASPNPIQTPPQGTAYPQETQAGPGTGPTNMRPSPQDQSATPSGPMSTQAPQNPHPPQPHPPQPHPPQPHPPQPHPPQSHQSHQSHQPPQQQQAGSPTLSEAVQAAHTEGYDFGETVARDAPALWLEAVLARKPRMPSDLEARLLQGSSLPIDFLLHDEVRHALRRGFWEALEESRR